MSRVVGAALIALAATVPARARAQQGDTLTVTLEHALAIARGGNPTYRQAVNNLGLNGPETLSTWSTFVLPSLSVGFGTSYKGNRQGQALDPFGNPVANPDAEFVNFSSTNQQIGLQWSLQGIAPLIRAKQARLANGQRELDEQLAGETLRLQVQRQFFGALEQEELLAAAEIAAVAAATDEATAQRLFELALRSRIELLQAQLEVERKAFDVRQRVGQRDQARLALRAALGRQDLPPVRPAATPATVFDPAGLDAEALVRRATEGSGAVRRQAAQLGLQDTQVSLAHGRYWPQLNASFFLSRTVQSRESTTGLFSVGGLPDRSFQVGVSIPFLDDPLAGRAQIARAEVARANLRDALRGTRLDAEQKVRSALAELRNRGQSIRIADRALAIASEALELAREEFRLGTRTFDALQPSVASEATARTQSIQARYGFVYAVLDLEAAVGGPVR